MAAIALVAGCATGAGGGSSGASGNTLTLWTHNAGNSAELDVVKKIIKDFNASRDTYKVELQALPQSDYNNSVVAAASARNISTEFQKAAQDILAGADPEDALGQAAKDIDNNLKTNDCYAG